MIFASKGIKNGASMTHSTIWEAIRREAREIARKEPVLADYLTAIVLNHPSLQDALSYLLAGKLASQALSAAQLGSVFSEAFANADDIVPAICGDIAAFDV